MNLRAATRSLVGCACALAGGAVQAAQGPQFDRPGLSFSTPSLAAGQVVWEQGLPDVSEDRTDGVRSTESVADTLLRFGVSETLELQLGADTYGHLEVRGDGVHRSASGRGDAHAGVKWALPGGGDQFSWAMLGTASFPTGTAPIGDGGHARDVGVTAAWDLADDRDVAVYADRGWSDDGAGWLLSASYAFALRDDVGAYVEAGAGNGAQHARVVGGGVTWMATPRLQLDASFLRGLDAASPDWQAGLGFSVVFAPAGAAR